MTPSSLPRERPRLPPAALSPGSWAKATGRFDAAAGASARPVAGAGRASGPSSVKSQTERRDGLRIFLFKPKASANKMMSLSLFHLKNLTHKFLAAVGVRILKQPVLQD